MLSHNSKYYCKSITANKVKSKSIQQLFTPGDTNSDKEQLSTHKIDVIKKRFIKFSVKEILVAYLFLPQTLITLIYPKRICHQIISKKISKLWTTIKIPLLASQEWTFCLPQQRDTRYYFN